MQCSDSNIIIKKAARFLLLNGNTVRLQLHRPMPSSAFQSILGAMWLEGPMDVVENHLHAEVSHLKVKSSNCVEHWVSTLCCEKHFI